MENKETKPGYSSTQWKDKSSNENCYVKRREAWGQVWDNRKDIDPWVEDSNIVSIKL